MALPASEIRLPRTVWALLATFAAVLAVLHERLMVVRTDAARFTFDAAEYALAGRAWLETGRLVTPFVHPAALGGSPGPPYPLLVGHPLVPALDALAFMLAGPTPAATVLPAMLAYVFTVLLTSRLALALTGSRAAALAAGAALALHPWALRYAVEGQSEMPFAALYTGALILLLRLPQQPRPLWLGVVLGLAHLARPVAVPLLPAFALGIVLLAPAAQRTSALVRAAVGFAPFALMVLLYRWGATGSPFADAGSYLLLTGVDPAHAVSKLNRMAPPPAALEWIRANPDLWLQKLMRNARTLSAGAVWWAGRPLVYAALAATVWLVARGGTRARGFLLAILVAMLTLFGLSAATVADPRMLFPLLPATIALALTGLSRAAEGIARGQRSRVAALMAAVIVVCALPLARLWRASLARSGPAAGAYREREWRGIGLGVRPMLPATGLVASDAAPWIAWYARVPTTLVPLEPGQLVTGPPRLRPVAVVLTNEWLTSQPGEEAWRTLLESRTPPPGFVVAGHVRSGRLEAVVWTRREMN